MSFLQQVARHYSHLSATELQSLVFVFPNRRAGLFFRRYLAAEIAQPLFSPSIFTINHFFQSLSTAVVAEPIDLLFRLYTVCDEVYLQPVGITETFDDFLFWGRMMLSDFNEVDMHLVDASRLFSNLADLKDIDIHFGQLSDDTRDSVNAFLAGFIKSADTPARRKFMHIWQCLLPIYNRFREELKADNLAYRGMLCRDVVEQLRHIETPVLNNNVVFVGFNALTAAEKQLMLVLHQSGKAQFCWDYSNPWLSDPQNRASLFAQENLSSFPNVLHTSSQTGIQHVIPSVHLMQIPSATGQARKIAEILSGLTPADWTTVGIVLPDENLLQPLLDVIPGNVDNVNITMGLSLRSTPVCSLLRHISEIQFLAVERDNTILFYHKPVTAILAHPYIQSVESERLVRKIRTGNFTYIPVSFFETSPVLSLLFKKFDNALQALETLHDLLLRLVISEEDGQILAMKDRQRNEYI